MILRARRRERELLTINTILRFEVTRLRRALEQIERTPHNEDGQCGSCLAELALSVGAPEEGSGS